MLADVDYRCHSSKTYGHCPFRDFLPLKLPDRPPPMCGGNIARIHIQAFLNLGSHGACQSEMYKGSKKLLDVIWRWSRVIKCDLVGLPVQLWDVLWPVSRQTVLTCPRLRKAACKEYISYLECSIKQKHFLIFSKLLLFHISYM